MNSIRKADANSTERTMKNFTRIFGIAAFTLLVVWACKKEEAEIGTPYDKTAGMAGTWEVTAVALIDEQSVLKDEVNLSKYYLDTAMRISFSAAEMAYEVSEGSGVNFFGESGLWMFDNPTYPAYLYLINTSDTARDTITMEMGTTVNEYINNLDLKFPRTCGDAVVSSYRFSFTRK